MTTTTPFLNLIEYNTITDGSVLINDFINDTSGSEITSNVNRLDVYATDTSASVAYLMANPQPAYISAVNISASYYEAINAAVTSYITNMMMILKLNVTTSASPTLKINSLSTVNLMKTNSIGNTIAIQSGDLLGGKEYQFRYDGTQWMWVSATSQDQSGISGTPGNLLMISTGSTVQDSGYSFSNMTSLSITPSSSAVNSLTLKTSAGSTILAVRGNDIILDYNTGNRIGTSASQKLVFYEGTPIIRPTVTGSSGGSDVVISLVQALANLGLIINGTT